MIRGLELEAITWQHVEAFGVTQGIETQECMCEACVPPLGLAYDMRIRGNAQRKLDLMAAFLNEDWVPDYQLSENDCPWAIAHDADSGFIANKRTALNFGLPTFRTAALCWKAITLMGDDLYTLFGLPIPAKQ